MSFHKKLSLSVIVVAKNHEQKITYLMRSVLKQNLHDYLLDRIIMICDGSSDHTPAKVSKYANKYPQITLLYYADSLGTNARVENIVNTLTSDVVLFIEPDIVLKGTNFIRDILSRFYAERIVMVTPATKIADGLGLRSCLNKKIFNLKERFSRLTRDDHFIFSLNQSAAAVRTDFVKKMKLPPDINLVNFLYFSTVHADNLVILCESAAIIKNYTDIINTMADIHNKDINRLKQIFGHLVEKEMDIKMFSKVRIAWITLISCPFSTVMFYLVKLTNFIGIMRRSLKSLVGIPQNYTLKKRAPSY